MTESDFEGFPAVGRATAIPHAFFTAVLPSLEAPGDLLAFLFAARLLQQRRGDAAFVSADDIWSLDGAPAAFTRLGGGRAGLVAGLDRCVAVRALLALDLSGPGSTERIYVLNDPRSRRLIARARAGELALRPGVSVRDVPVETPPGVFRLYEENVGTITPLIGERLLAAAEEYPQEWLERAVREAVELNRRNWRYIERVLQRWAVEGPDEVDRRSSFESGTRPPGGAGVPARYR
ncbi:MAG: DnaD domain-containing protein [Dehalococcoidia bacterium]